MNNLTFLLFFLYFIHTKNFGDVIEIEVGAVCVGKIVNLKENNKFKKCEAKEMIKRKCIEAKPKTNFNEYKEDRNRAESIFEKAWKDKTPLREISKVEISKEVLDWFLNLEETFVISDEEQERLKKRRPNVSIKNNHPVNWKRTKYLFTLYIWTKIQENYLSRPNIHYLQNYVKRFREDADLKPSFSLNNERNLL